MSPTTGVIRIFGSQVPTRKVAVGYVPQNTNANLDFPITVSQCVSTGFLYQKSIKDEIDFMLSRVGMLEKAEKRLGELSGGERQRVLLARALACKPRILFLDEPSSNMDANGQELLFSLLASLNKEMTIVLVSHDLMAMSKNVKSVLCVNRCVHYHPGAGSLSKGKQKVYPLPPCRKKLHLQPLKYRNFQSLWKLLLQKPK